MIFDQGGIDGVEIVGAVRGDDGAVIAPIEIGSGWIQRGIGSQPNDGSIFAEAGDRIVKEKAILHLDHVRSPVVHTPIVGNGFEGPIRKIGEERWTACPIKEVGRMEGTNAAAGREEPPLVAITNDGGRIMEMETLADGVGRLSEAIEMRQ